MKMLTSFELELVKKLSDVLDDLDFKESRLQHASEERNEMLRSISSKRETIKAKNELNESLTSELSEVKEENKKLTEKNQELNDNNVKYVEYIQELREEVHRLQTELDDLNTIVDVDE